MLANDRLVILGAGNMGQALLRGVLSAELFGKEHVLAVERLAERQQEVERMGVAVTTDLAEAASFGTVFVLAVKPKDLPNLLRDLAPLVRADQLFISIAAGVSLSTLQSHLPGAVFRVMPNTPALIGAGISAIACGERVSEADRQKVATLLGALGEWVFVSEDLIDGVTGLSGSGPAYVFLFIEALTDGGVAAGLPREVARKLAVQTVLGAARLVEQTGQHPAVLKDQVTSPGGTTIAGLRVLAERGFHSAVMEAVLSATARSKELAKGEG